MPLRARKQKLIPRLIFPIGFRKNWIFPLLRMRTHDYPTIVHTCFIGPAISLLLARFSGLNDELKRDDYSPLIITLLR